MELVVATAVLMIIAAGLVRRRGAGAASVSTTEGKDSRAELPSPSSALKPTAPIRVTDPSTPSAELAVQFIPPSFAELTSGEASTAFVSPTATRNAFDHLVGAIPEAAVLLEQGMVMRVVGPPEKLAALAEGTLKLVDSNGKTLATTRDAATGQFAGSLELGSGITRIGAALGVFQVMSVVTGQYFLARIDEQLGAVLNGVDELLRGQAAQQYGDLMAAADLNERVRRDLVRGALANDDDRRRLHDASLSCERLYATLLKQLTDFVAFANDFSPAEASARELSSAFERAEAERERLSMLALAAFLRQQTMTLELAVTSDTDAIRVSNLQERMEEKRVQAVGELNELRRAFDRVLNISPARIEARTKFRRTAPLMEQRNVTRQRLKQGRELIASADTALLPAAPPRAVPFYAEVQGNEGGVLTVRTATVVSA